jgi:IS30 family transposase
MRSRDGKNKKWGPLRSGASAYRDRQLPRRAPSRFHGESGYHGIETIYRGLFVQARGALKKEQVGHLRSKRRIRRSRHATHRGGGRGEIIDAVSIQQGPAEIEDRAIPGHWEGDLMAGSRRTFIATLVERQSRFGLLRQYYPKGANLSAVSQAQLDTVARKLNTRQRETLHWKTPAYTLDASVSMTH